MLLMFFLRRACSVAIIVIKHTYSKQVTVQDYIAQIVLKNMRRVVVCVERITLIFVIWLA